MELLASNNCVYAVKRQATGAGYALAGLRSAPPIIIQGATFSDRDLVLPVNCLNGKRFLYAFGKQFGSGTLLGVALLGMTGVPNLNLYVQALRTSSGANKATLSTPLGGYRVFVTGFGLGMPDVDYNIQPFSVDFTIAQ